MTNISMTKILILTMMITTIWGFGDSTANYIQALNNNEAYTPDYDQYSTEYTYFNDEGEKMFGSTGDGQEAQDFDKTIGATFSWGGTILNIITYPVAGFWTDITATGETELEKMIHRVLTILRGMLYLIMALQVYFIIKNKKSE